MQENVNPEVNSTQFSVRLEVNAPESDLKVIDV